MKTQVQNHQSKGIKAVYLCDLQQTLVQNETPNQVDEGLKKMCLDDPGNTMEIIFSSPESPLGNYRDLVLKLGR